jgi:hypothetical protein
MDTQAREKAGGHSGDVARFVVNAGQDGTPDSYSGKRKSTRFSEGVMLDVTTDPGRTSASLLVYMHNVSDGGFGFWSRKKVPARTVLFVREHSEEDDAPWVQAQVTHCTFGLRGFLVGASFGNRTSTA